MGTQANSSPATTAIHHTPTRMLTMTNTAMPAHSMDNTSTPTENRRSASERV